MIALLFCVLSVPNSHVTDSLNKPLRNWFSLTCSKVLRLIWNQRFITVVIQEPAVGTDPELVESSQIIMSSVCFNIIIPCMPNSPKWFCSLGSSTESGHTCLVSSVRATYHGHVILFSSVALTVFGEGTNYASHQIFSNLLSLCSS
jgi:hypothetical protein